MIEIGDIFNLIDGSWGLIFPDYYKSFRSVNSPRNMARIKVLSNESPSYSLMLMEVATEDGRVFIPIGMNTICTKHEVDIAMALTNKKRRGDIKIDLTS